MRQPIGSYVILIPWNEPYPSSLTNLVILEGVVLQSRRQLFDFHIRKFLSILAITAIADWR